jgi:hypothetical protein
MEHTKGNLYVKEPFGVTAQINVVGGSPHGVFIEVNPDRNKPVDSCAIRALEDAERLVNCWNEHDTLKAKADKYDNIVDLVTVLDKQAKGNPTGANKIVEIVTEALLKALK